MDEFKDIDENTPDGEVLELEDFEADLGEL